MRKKSSYRPRPVLINPVLYVVESMRPASQHDDYLINLRIKNHGAMMALTKGEATTADIDMLISMVNTTEALYRLGFGRDYKDVVKSGLDALESVGKRGSESLRFILRPQEMTDLNLLMELHDAQLDLITLQDMEKANAIINGEWASKKMRIIKKGKT